MNYVASGIGPGLNITAATAQNVHLYQPAASTMASIKVYEWSAGPHANSADNTYTVAALTRAPACLCTIGWTSSNRPTNTRLRSAEACAATPDSRTIAASTARF